MIIVGAGLSGLIAANLLPDARIVEAGPERDVSKHRALLRFRSADVGNAVGIEFKQVTVHKGIWDGSKGGFVPPSIRLANLYSQKVIGALGDRSIWKLEPAQRFIAPEDLYARLVARCKTRIEWGKSVNFVDAGPYISTAPLGETIRAVGLHAPHEFHYAPIKVKRYRISNADVYQTIYFPDPDTSVYRASITGDLLITEHVNGNADLSDGMGDVLEAFGLSEEPRSLDEAKQKFGKIAPVPNAWRREAIFQLTHSFRIYSLGRFATWRNILLDDVLKDVFVIKRLIDGDAYALARQK